MTDQVLFETLATASGHRWGIATLNAPASLNALSLPMVRQLRQQLDGWADDPTFAGVTLQASGPKAFCAGGDLRALYPSLVAGEGDQAMLARAFFSEEYSLDHAIHHYPKPLMGWAHGLVMGGGVGLLAGASHRVVTLDTRLSMPEISIGLYPDVGGSWFLRRMPGRSGLFAGLTGAAMNAADTVYAGLAHYVIDQAHKEWVHDQIAGLHWNPVAQARHAQLDEVLVLRATKHGENSPFKAHAAAIEQLMAGDSLLAMADRLAGPQPNAWLAAACDNFRRGSPTSAALTYELWKRCEHLPTIADVLRLEFNVSLACCAHSDLKEGIRAVLIDKDRKPRWNPPDLHAAIGPNLEAFFRPRHVGEHPLARLHDGP